MLSATSLIDTKTWGCAQGAVAAFMAKIGNMNITKVLVFSRVLICVIIHTTHLLCTLQPTPCLSYPHCPMNPTIFGGMRGALPLHSYAIWPL